MKPEQRKATVLAKSAMEATHGKKDKHMLWMSQSHELDELRRTVSNIVKFLLLEKDENLPAVGTVHMESREKGFHEVEVQTPETRQEELELENERLKTRVTELQRSSNREIQHYDQGSKRFDDVLSLLHEDNKANDVLQAVLVAGVDGRLRMFETYDGVVKQADDDEIVVLFEINDELIEQTYKKEQFIGGRLPSQGDRFSVYVHDAILQRIEEEKEYNPSLTRVKNGKTQKLRKFDTGPLEV